MLPSGQLPQEKNMKGFTLVEMIMVLGVITVVVALAALVPLALTERDLGDAAAQMLRNSIARARTDAMARRSTIVVVFEQIELDKGKAVRLVFVELGKTPEDDAVVGDACLPEGSYISEEEFPLNAALNEPLDREDSRLNGARAFVAFSGSGALVSLSGEDVRPNLRLCVKTETGISESDFGIAVSTGIVLDCHFPARDKDLPPMVEFAGLDTETRGDWPGIYGSSGRILCNYYSGSVVENRQGGHYDITKIYDFSQLPDYVADYSYTHSTVFSAVASWGAFVWGNEVRHTAPGEDDSSGLVRPDGSRVGSSVMAKDPLKICVTFTLRDAKEHIFSIYSTENSPSERYMTVTVESLDENGDPTGEPVETECSADEYRNGIWFRFRVTGSFRVTLKNVSTNKNLDPNTFVSGFFFDEPQD